METELKPIAEKRYHRVIVNVTDDEIADNELGNSMSTMLRPKKIGNSSARMPSQNLNADVDVLNCTTLSLNKKNHQNPGERTHHVMFFDCVGRTETDPLVRYEIGSMFDLLMIDRRNCCLINFKPIRERPTHLFNTMLVPEVDKRLMMLQGTMALRKIVLEYHDVQKYDVVNMCKKMKGGLFKKSSNHELIFQNTRELLRWTQQTYHNLWVNGSEHECFDLEFVFTEVPKMGARSKATEVRIKFSILLCYLNKMDGDLRVGLRSFLENVNRADLRIKHSILTDYLRDFFLKEEDSWQIWMIFDVPSVNIGSSLASDMLTLARAAYVGVHETAMQINKTDIDVLYKNNRQTAGRNSVTSFSTLASSSFSVSNSSQKSNIPTNNRSKFATKIANYSLSFWYSRIDDSFVNVITSLERYYDRKYELRVQGICGELKRMTDGGGLKKTKNAHKNGFEIEKDEELQNYYKQYADALQSFQILVKKVESTKYAEHLKTFVESKNMEIATQTRQMKMRLLELCQAKISNTIKEEVKNLNMAKETISKISSEIIRTVES